MQRTFRWYDYITINIYCAPPPERPRQPLPSIIGSGRHSDHDRASRSTLAVQRHRRRVVIL